MKRSASALIAAGLLVALAACPPAQAAGSKPYKIVLSNNFVGNDWRQQMIRSAEVAVKKPPLAGEVELTVQNVENTTEAQIASLNNIIRDHPDAIVVADRQGVIRFWNAGAEATFGYPAAEATGKSLDLIIPESLRQRHWTGYDVAMSRAATKYGAESLKVPALHQSGRRLSIEFRILLLRDGRGALVGIAAFLRDVTAAWEEQRELRRRLAALERTDPG